MSGGLGLGQAPPGAGNDNDPYNIPIDLTNIKRPAQPEKPFEQKTSEEKMLTAQQME